VSVLQFGRNYFIPAYVR